MSSTQFLVGALVPPLVKWANSYLKKFFKLTELNVQIKERVTTKQYPFYYSFLYNLWVIIILGSGIAVLLFLMIDGSALFPGKSFAILTFVGLINMIGAWFIFGALLDVMFWQVSSENFRDYVKFWQFKSGWGYDIKQQISTLVKIGIIYYISSSGSNPVKDFLDANLKAKVKALRIFPT